MGVAPAYLAVSITHGGGMTMQAAGVGALCTALTYITSMSGSIYGGTLSDRWGRTRVILWSAFLSLACSFTFGWMMALPLWLLVAVAAIYNITAIADSSVYSTGITELVPPQYLGAAYALRSVLGFGAGVISPWVFGLVIDWGARRTAPLGDHGVGAGVDFTRCRRRARTADDVHAARHARVAQHGRRKAVTLILSTLRLRRAGHSAHPFGRVLAEYSCRTR